MLPISAATRTTMSAGNLKFPKIPCRDPTPKRRLQARSESTLRKLYDGVRDAHNYWPQL